ncbi:MAG: GTPase Era [Chloroflexota bacterium]
MSDNQFEWPDEATEAFAEDIEAGLLFDETLPADYRSGFIAVVGRPNVGKSTLLNAFLETKVAIVSPKPQTTRNRLLGILTSDQEQLVFIDTPGVHDPHHKFGQYMVDTALRSIPDSDLILWLVDGTRPPHKEDRIVADTTRKTKRRVPVIMALNKVDVLQPDVVSTRMDEYLTLLDPDIAIAISAQSGHNRAKLLQMITDHMPFGPRFFPADQLTDQHTRFIAAEMIREAALTVLRQEVPHALVVQINAFKERSETMTYIDATIFVERESQKPIVIGRQGKVLKQVGQKARTEIEAMTEGKVYLDLHVKVQPNWRHKQKELKRFGYALQDEKR